ncbi:MAG: MarR family winged helix-turn-helix transcriptional regulator [Thermoleophilaceae bacterium]
MSGDRTSPTPTPGAGAEASAPAVDPGVEARLDPATEAWSLFLGILFGERPQRLPAVAAEFDVSPMGVKLLQILEPGVEKPMSALAERVYCDASNVTGMVDRLEARALVERRDDPRDRRVKLIALTEDGVELRGRVLARLFEPPEPIERLSRAEQRELRDLLRRAVDG